MTVKHLLFLNLCASYKALPHVYR